MNTYIGMNFEGSKKTQDKYNTHMGSFKNIDYICIISNVEFLRN